MDVLAEDPVVCQAHPDRLVRPVLVAHPDRRRVFALVALVGLGRLRHPTVQSLIRAFGGVNPPAKDLLDCLAGIGDPRPERPLLDLRSQNPAADLVLGVAGHPTTQILVPAHQQQILLLLVAQGAHVPGDDDRRRQRAGVFDADHLPAQLVAEFAERSPDLDIHRLAHRSLRHADLDPAARHDTALRIHHLPSQNLKPRRVRLRRKRLTHQHRTIRLARRRITGGRLGLFRLARRRIVGGGFGLWRRRQLCRGR